jgi:hypothetical protein
LGRAAAVAEPTHDPETGVVTAAIFLMMTGFCLALVFTSSWWWAVPAFGLGILGGFGLGQDLGRVRRG